MTTVAAAHSEQFLQPTAILLAHGGVDKVLIEAVSHRRPECDEVNDVRNVDKVSDNSDDAPRQPRPSIDCGDNKVDLIVSGSRTDV